MVAIAARCVIVLTGLNEITAAIGANLDPSGTASHLMLRLQWDRLCKHNRKHGSQRNKPAAGISRQSADPFEQVD